MGACVSSVHKNPDSATKFRLPFGSKTEKLVIQSPIKDKKPIITGDRPISDVGLKSQWPSSQPVTTSFRGFGSKEETFFDSQAWLESDCEDDFLSVNGDFTPSRGSTPVHHKFSTEKSTVHRVHFENGAPVSQPEPSPKKKLVELFRDGLRDDQHFDEQSLSNNQSAENGKVEGKTNTLDLPLKSENGTPYISTAASGCSSERTPNGNLRHGRWKSIRSMQACLPSLLSSCSFGERKKQRTPIRCTG